MLLQTLTTCVCRSCLNIKLTVVGFHNQSETVHQILTDGWTTGLGGANNGADAHIPSNVKIPQPGEWAIFLYKDKKLFDILFYELKSNSDYEKKQTNV